VSSIGGFVSGTGGATGGGVADAAVGGVTGVGAVGDTTGAGGGFADWDVGGVTGVGGVGGTTGAGGGFADCGVGIWNCCGGGMTCAPGAAVCGTVVTTADERGDASSTIPRPSVCEGGRAVSAPALGERAPGRTVVGRAVAGQSFEGEGPVVVAGCLLTGRAVSGQSFEGDAEGRVVVSFREAAGRAGAGGGFASALARAARAAALFGSKRGGSVCLLT
jgi:hypothetical protein